MARDLREFLRVAREAGPAHYQEAARPVKPDYEVGVIQHKLAKQGRFPVVYCPQVEGSKLPLVSNLFGCYDLLGLALGVRPDMLNEPGRSVILAEYRRREHNLMPPVEIPPSLAPVRDLVLRGNDVDLDLLPINRHAPMNSARYVTIGMTAIRDPDNGKVNVGIYRHEVKSKTRLALRMLRPHHGAEIALRYAELQRAMPVVIFIGHHPLVAMAAGSPCRAEVSEFELMGALLQEPLAVTRAATIDMLVPAFAEIAVEGLVDTARTETEGPFSEGMGYYGEADQCYVIEITAITMRGNAIYNDLHPTHQEHRLVGMLGRESKLYDGIGSTGVEVVGVHVGPESRCGKALGYVSIRKRSQKDVELAGIAALPPGSGNKIVVVLDDDIDVYDEDEVLWALATRISNVYPVRVSDSGASLMGCGEGLPASGDGKLILDATRPLDKPFPARVTLPQEVWDSVSLKDHLR